MNSIELAIMKKLALVAVIIPLLFSGYGKYGQRLSGPGDNIIKDSIQYHPVRLDEAGNILPWYSSNPGESYDTILTLIWNFWKNMRPDSNGLKYYMNHQVWKPEHDARGLGGDQFNMALSSWTLLYQYTGDPSVVEDMKYIADYYLGHSLSEKTDQWPDLPYPYNMRVHSGVYDGDMRAGKGYLQPDKAGNFGYELVNLFKITGEKKYLQAATRIGQTLAEKTRKGDNDNSPLPFRVEAKTGKVGPLIDNRGTGKQVGDASYTSNWSCTMMLFQQLQKLDEANKGLYSKAFEIILAWMKEFPLKTNKWGPFFEDVPGWSDTQTNAISFAMFIMLNRDLFPDWKKDVKGIFEWTYKELGNHEYDKYHVTVMNEQTVYRVPGNSHSSRQASVELLYTELSGDTTYKTNSIRILNWATYTVAADGRNRYIRDDVWLTDGYGDYVRHYLRAMASDPDLAPAKKNKLLKTTSVITHINYSGKSIDYETYDRDATETLRMTLKPSKIMIGTAEAKEQNELRDDSWSWTPLKTGGILKIKHIASNQVTVNF